MLWVGGACLLGGWALAFLTVIKLLAPSFIVAFLVVALLTVGTVLGFYSVFSLYRARRD